ncbi:hypothetical protein QR680_002856 [Steinernema hermaphroditum]|uniref:Uncharacterized protein n=1 Tax=Steinernema hermaphroditum TaxID=289476 RepID=A0AA39LII9_9BILA|nr:hypothetical protein QR680_002856 [Steinernema hermaphroditum]
MSPFAARRSWLKRYGERPPAFASGVEESEYSMTTTGDRLANVSVRFSSSTLASSPSAAFVYRPPPPLGSAMNATTSQSQTKSADSGRPLLCAESCRAHNSCKHE